MPRVVRADVPEVHIQDTLFVIPDGVTDEELQDFIKDQYGVQLPMLFDGSYSHTLTDQDWVTEPVCDLVPGWKKVITERFGKATVTDLKELIEGVEGVEEEEEEESEGDEEDA
jgi:hypothetical protein